MELIYILLSTNCQGRKSDFQGLLMIDTNYIRGKITLIYYRGGHGQDLLEKDGDSTFVYIYKCIRQNSMFYVISTYIMKD